MKVDNSAMTADIEPPAGKQRGQSLVEFAISSIVLLLLTMGLLDFSRAFYFQVNLEGAAREGARHGAWFDTASRRNIYLDDSDIMAAVSQGLSGAGLNPTLATSPACLPGADGNTLNNKPYSTSAYPASTQKPLVYICYTRPASAGGGQSASMGLAPSDNSWRLGDINVIILMEFQIITPFIQNLFGTGIPLAVNEHFTIQGKP